LPRQPVAAPRRLELMPGPKVQPIPLPPVGGFKEQIMDPALVAKKAAFLQAQGMGGGGAAFSNVQQFLDSIGDRANIFGQLRALGIAQAPKASLTGVQRRLVQAYTGSASGALSFETMRRAAPASIEFALFKEILEASSRILGPEMNDFGLPRAISEFSSLPITPAMKPFLDPEVFEQFLKNRSWAILDVAKHIRSPEDLANILNIAAKELENIMETHGITLPNDILLHRGLGMLRGPSNDVLKYVNSAYGIGRSLAPQFRSTSTSDSTARAFTTIKAGDTPLIPLLEHILAPKGTRVFMPDAYGLGLGNEREILLPPRYRLVPSRVDLNVGYKHLDLAEVFGTLAKGVAAGVAAFGGVYGLSGNNKASAYALTEPQKFTEYLKQIRLLSEFIAGGESLNVKDPYSAWFGGKAMMMPDMTSMTINDVIANANNRAVGKYQNLPKYLLARARLANFSGSDLYNESVQEAIMMATLLEKSPVSLGLIDYMTGNMSIDTAVNRIARTWLSMPQLGGAYVGIGANPKGFDRGRKDLVIQAYLNRIKNLYAGFKAGGYVPGSPSMPFPAILHGGEYVVNAGAVRNMGIETMKNINQSKFRTPSGMPLYQSGGQTTTVSTLNINVDTFIGEEEWFKSMMQNYNIHILPRVQKNAGIESRSFKTYNGINQGM